MFLNPSSRSIRPFYMQRSHPCSNRLDKRRRTSSCVSAQLALFEALNILKSIASLPYAWLCNISVHKREKIQQK